MRSMETGVEFADEMRATDRVSDSAADRFTADEGNKALPQVGVAARVDAEQQVAAQITCDYSHLSSNASSGNGGGVFWRGDSCVFGGVVLR